MTLFILSCKQSTDLLILMPFHTFLSLFWLNSTIEDTFALMNEIISLDSFQRDKTSKTFFFLISKTFFYENGNNLIEMERKRYHLAFNTACMRFFPASLHFLRIKKMPNLSLWFFFWYRCHNDVFFASFNLIKVFSPWNFTCRIYIYCLTMQGHFFQFVIFKWIGAF